MGFYDHIYQRFLKLPTEGSESVAHEGLSVPLPALRGEAVISFRESGAVTLTLKLPRGRYELSRSPACDIEEPFETLDSNGNAHTLSLSAAQAHQTEIIIRSKDGREERIPLW